METTARKVAARILQEPTAANATKQAGLYFSVKAGRARNREWKSDKINAYLQEKCDTLQRLVKGNPAIQQVIDQACVNHRVYANPTPTLKSPAPHPATLLAAGLLKKR